MKQTFVATPTPLLENGKLKTAGYSTHMNFIYDGKTVKSRRLKEWDFYQILSATTFCSLRWGMFPMQRRFP